ncbi:hypothetical protein IMCC3317_15710 [Kordia antarctica]|uniref:Thioredoxin domain-containing protein n=1 Tax=Kordia antarctica TaxID=1218801 RepID=A0A7L4ZHV6_9FLAO|nr:TlpA disulfide reductase family protein [Kordia antarctica]QHI36212.1 hypothetical protein IMCC3317_15710 [Kordia antarctica]
MSKKLLSIAPIVIIIPIICITMFILSSSKNHEEKDSQIIIEEKISDPELTFGKPIKTNNIVVIGKSDDPGVFKRPNFINDTYLFGRPHKDLEKNIQNDSITFILKKIDKPLLMEFSPSGDKKYFSTIIYISPNDTVLFEVKNNKLIFTGKNATQNNLYTKLEAETLEYGKTPYEDNLLSYKEKIKAVYEDKKQFFNNYISKNKVSKEFISAFEKLLKYEYYDNLASPRNVMVISKNGDFYVNDYNALPTLIEKEYLNSEIPFDSDAYFDGLSVKDFQDIEAMRNTHFFKNSISVLVQHHFTKHDAPYYSEERFKAEIDFTEKNFKGKIRDYIIGRMIWDYYNKGFAFGSQNINFMVNVIDEYMASVEGKETHITAMQEIKNDILTYDFEMSESALNSKMINHVGDTITLRDIFNRSKKRIKVVDFWASWCPPCIKQIQESKPFKDRLSVENNVEWIYLSIDTDREKWLEKGKQLDNFLNFRNSYVLVKGKKSSLARALQVHQIPRYVIFDKNHKVIVNSAPSPSDEEVFERIIDDAQSPKPIR